MLRQTGENRQEARPLPAAPSRLAHIASWEGLNGDNNFASSAPGSVACGWLAPGKRRS